MICDANFKRNLYRAGEEAADLIRRVPLHCFRDMPVGIEGESGAIVTEEAGEGFDIHAVLERKCSESVPIWYNCDNTDKPNKIKGLRIFRCSFSMIF